jgi:hypothetical protein
LSGTYRRAAGLEAKAYLYVPDGYRPLLDAPGFKGLCRMVKVGANLWAQEIHFQNAQVDWAVPFTNRGKHDLQGTPRSSEEGTETRHTQLLTPGLRR